MSSPLQRLAELGLAVPTPAAPVAAYVPAVRTGSLAFTSGQLPIRDGELVASGRVGAEVDADAAASAARVCALNCLGALTTVVGDLDCVLRIVKVVGYVASDPSFTGQPKVINGASELLQDVFGVAGQHARSAIGVAVLPMGAPVEVELVAEVR